MEFIALKGKGSDCEARQTRSGRILEVELIDNFEFAALKGRTEVYD